MSAWLAQSRSSSTADQVSGSRFQPVNSSVAPVSQQSLLCGSHMSSAGSVRRACPSHKRVSRAEIRRAGATRAFFLASCERHPFPTWRRCLTCKEGTLHESSLGRSERHRAALIGAIDC